jgi:putative PIN family toxin of toxin-antitoxin system
MRVVLDSNVIVAAFAARGICSALFEYCVEKVEVVLCEEMLREIEKAIVGKVGAPPTVAREVVGYLTEVTETVIPAEVDPAACKDKGDLPVLGAAVAGKCVYIITGDAKLRALQKYQGVEIVSPREFWERLKQLPENRT